MGKYDAEARAVFEWFCYELSAPERGATEKDGCILRRPFLFPCGQWETMEPVLPPEKED